MESGQTLTLLSINCQNKNLYTFRRRNRIQTLTHFPPNNRLKKFGASRLFAALLGLMSRKLQRTLPVVSIVQLPVVRCNPSTPVRILGQHLTAHYWNALVHAVRSPLETPSIVVVNAQSISCHYLVTITQGLDLIECEINRFDKLDCRDARRNRSEHPHDFVPLPPYL